MMRVRGLNNVGRAVQTDPSTITEKKELLGAVGLKVLPVSNFVQQHATTCNRMCKRTPHLSFNNVGSCWPKMLRPFVRG